jgi:hypothetical protein
VAKIASQALADTYEQYNYNLVDARAALLDMGIDVPASKALAVFQVVLPPDDRTRFGDFFLEDVRIAQLREGGSETPQDWLLVKAFAQERVLKRLTDGSLKKLMEKKK